MGSKFERRKKRNEDREVARSFHEMGKTAMVREIRDMSEKKQKELLAKLDSEAADAFRGLMRITDKAVEAHAPVIDTFDSVRHVMIEVRDGRYREAYREVKELVGQPNAMFKVRSILVRIGHDLAALARWQMGTADLEPGETETLLVARVNAALQEVTAYAANDAETIEEEDFDAVGQITVDLPAEVTEPMMVERVTLLVLPDRKLPTAAAGVRALTSGTYLIEATLIGVATEIEPDEREAAAQKYAMRVLGASVSPFALTRPDSDGVWFPVFKQRFAAELVHFPDQARRYYGTSSAMSERAGSETRAKSLRLQALRADFERENNDVFDELAAVQSEYDDSQLITVELAAAFFERTGYRPTVKFETIRAHYEQEHEFDLAAVGSDFAKRWQLNQAFNEKMKELAQQQATIVALRAKDRQIEKRIAELEAQIAARKRSTLNPFHKLSERIANMGQVQPA